MPEEPSAVPTGQRPRVLLVGGGLAVRVEPLRQRFEVDLVATAEEALTKAHRNPPHIVLVWQGLGDIGAGELFAELRADPALHRLPALLVGSHADADTLADELVREDASHAHLAGRVAVQLALARLREEGLRREQGARGAAEAANQAKDEFIAMISHELRTPLGAILIWSQLLQTQDLDRPAIARAVGMIERSTKTLAQLIDDLLDVSRIIAGKLSVETSPLELGALLDAVVDAALPSAQAKDVQLEKSRDPEPAHVAGDAGRLQQVLTNLLANAVKFTGPGGRVAVRLTRSAGQARVEVSDTGNGISAEFLPFIFDRFRQADTTTTRREKGLGLGLSIARHIVELHGGSIEAASDGEGRGSTFSVMLPLLQSGTDHEVAARASLPAAASLAGIRILLVDDEEDAREAMVVLLAQAGAEVLAVASAAEAAAAIAADIPDVLLSDIAMPGEDGYALIGKVRSLPPGRGGMVPAAALTAYATREDRSKALRAGFNEHVPKPVDPSRLIAVVIQLARRTRG